VVRFKARLAAAFAEWKDFSGIQRALRIERVVNAAHEIEVRVGEEKRHEFAFLHADAVFAGEAAADFDAVANDFRRGFHGALKLLVVAEIVENDGMEIAVAGMEDVADVEAELGTDFVNATQGLRKFRTRDHAVEDVDAGSDAAERAEGILAAFPEEVAFFVVASDADFARFVSTADFVDGGGLGGHGFQHAFDFEKEDGPGIHREASMDVVLDDAECPAVEHFASGGSDAARGDVGDGFGGVVYRFEYGEQRFDRFGFASQLDGDFGDESERAFGADEEAGEVVGAGVALLAADAYDFSAGGEDEFESGDVIGGDAIGECVRAAGVFGDVAADGGGFLAGGIGCEVEAGVFDGAGDVEIYDAGLNDGALVFEVEFKDAIHPREHEHEAAGTGERAAGEAGACTAAEDRDVVLVGEADNLRDLGGGRREGDEVGAAFFDGAVVFVEDEVFGAGEDGVVTEKFLERASEVAVGFRVWRCRDAWHGGIRLAQMERSGEMTWTYLEEEL
jgi:hypothetical protein